jgi:hypothetical protein
MIRSVELMFSPTRTLRLTYPAVDCATTLNKSPTPKVTNRYSAEGRFLRHSKRTFNDAFVMSEKRQYSQALARIAGKQTLSAHCTVPSDRTDPDKRAAARGRA